MSRCICGTSGAIPHPPVADHRFQSLAECGMHTLSCADGSSTPTPEPCSGSSLVAHLPLSTIDVFASGNTPPAEGSTIGLPQLRSAFTCEGLQVTTLQNLEGHTQWHDYSQCPPAPRSRVGASHPRNMGGRGRLLIHLNEVVPPSKVCNSFSRLGASM